MIFLRQYFVTEPQHCDDSSSDICNKNAHERTAASERARSALTTYTHRHTRTRTHTKPICCFLFPKGGPSIRFPCSMHIVAAAVVAALAVLSGQRRVAVCMCVCVHCSCVVSERESNGPAERTKNAMQWNGTVGLHCL